MTASTTASDNPEWFLDDPELVIALVHWAMSKGAIITRDWLGLPPAETVPARLTQADIADNERRLAEAEAARIRVLRQAVDHEPEYPVQARLEHERRVLYPDEVAAEAGHGQAPGPAPGFMPWPDLSRDHDVREILAAILLVDAHLDADTAQAYRDQPLAGHWSRITKAVDEAAEAKEALEGVTGENPRKGVCDTWEHVTEELGDTACAALLGIQHITKDTDVTWAVFIAALAKGLSRIPQERPAPDTASTATTEGDKS
jgi:hypothetical protein